MQELSRCWKRRAKALLGLSSVAEAHTGAVCAVQRSDSALRLNVHLHTLLLDGVYTRDDPMGPLTFHPLPTPTHADVADLAARTTARIEKVLKAHGGSLDPESGDDPPPPRPPPPPMGQLRLRFGK